MKGLGGGGAGLRPVNTEYAEARRHGGVLGVAPEYAERGGGGGFRPVNAEEAEARRVWFWRGTRMREAGARRGVPGFYHAVEPESRPYQRQTSAEHNVAGRAEVLFGRGALAAAFTTRPQGTAALPISAHTHASLTRAHDSLCRDMHDKDISFWYNCRRQKSLNRLIFHHGRTAKPRTGFTCP